MQRAHNNCLIGKLKWCGCKIRIQKQSRFPEMMSDFGNLCVWIVSLGYFSRLLFSQCRAYTTWKSDPKEVSQSWKPKNWKGGRKGEHLYLPRTLLIKAIQNVLAVSREGIKSQGSYQVYTQLIWGCTGSMEAGRSASSLTTPLPLGTHTAARCLKQEAGSHDIQLLFSGLEIQ